MKKEGLKFLVSRIYNYESKPDGCTRKYKLCSIADDHFFLQPGEEDRSEYNFDVTDRKCTDPDCNDECVGDLDEGEDGEYSEYNDNGHELYHLSFKSMKYHIKIQRKNRNEYGRWDCETSNYERKSEKPMTKKRSKKNDKVTQYGDDNPDEDFFEGAIFMAVKILKRETTTQRLECYLEDDSYENETCDRCIDGCECPCGTKICICAGEDSEDDCDCEPGEKCYCFGDDSSKPQTCYLGANPYKFAEKTDVCDEYSKDCGCQRCNCAENKKISNKHYQTYQVWRSGTPGELVEELANKIVLLRKDRYLPQTVFI